MISSIPRVVIAGTGSGTGKTTVTLGLMAALGQRGLNVQGFKVGPDFIDPGFHTAVTGRPSRNLDTWMVPHDTVSEIFLRGSEGSDLAVVEGVMGLFDGRGPMDDAGSTAELAALLQAPVILVVDVSGMARSSAAVVRGFQTMRPDVRVCGVIANRCGGEGHFRIIRDAVEQMCGIPVIGWLPDEPEVRLPERHLGLVPALERAETDSVMARIGSLVSRHVDLDLLEKLAQEAPALKWPGRRVFVSAYPPVKHGPVIAVALDDAFHFYYRDNFDLLELNGAKLRFFSPLADEPVPEEADGLWFGGGFPEEFADRLAANERTKASIREAVRKGLPIYAECGGYMYLGREITDRQGNVWPMVGVVPASFRMEDRLVAIGYREVTAAVDSVLHSKGERARGHEFHWSSMTSTDPYPAAYEAADGSRIPADGYVRRNLLAGYTHLHFASNPEMVRRWIRKCLEQRQRKEEH
ncbi:cobyrinate a,c-diamide synthase [Staphylospora marina]|uniref:cobyrinate a,c-diamide synthase n=1 Tax=Staphylospora marina TaxID=2490858 RepID=UPI000F5B927E|nr:cobyrinate a,c-diamide synthase [Staphylospora marina]